jgi:hypothetical protein
MTGQRQHLHLDDYPRTFELHRAILCPERHEPGQLATAGYEATEHGAYIDWNALATSWLSSTEAAAIHVAHGIAIAEAHGGWPRRLRGPLADAITGA